MVSTTGFDRLREFGFSEEDIQGIRTQFHEEQGEGDDAEVALRRREREEEWMNSMASETQEEESKAGKKRGRGRGRNKSVNLALLFIDMSRWRLGGLHGHGLWHDCWVSLWDSHALFL